MNGGHGRSGALALAFLLALLVAATTGAAPKDGPTASLSVTQDAFGSSEDVLVTVTLSNPTKHTVHILGWFTPVSDVGEPLFTVTRDGTQVAYVGPLYKRPSSTRADYVQLKAGESIKHVVDLGALYDLSQSGGYVVSYNVASEDLFGAKRNPSGARDSLTSEPISIKVDARAGKGKPPPPPPPAPGGNSFNACSLDQQAALLAARTAASGYATNSSTYLAGTQGARYTTWFGVFDATRHGKVKANFTAIGSAMTNAGIAFDCKSKQNVYAYVYPNDPYKIYLGRVYWTAPATGTDSKAGTLIHEMSHFTVVADTDDVVYGQTGAKNLAITDPAAAIRNADSHEYFAENTPSLP